MALGLGLALTARQAPAAPSPYGPELVDYQVGLIGRSPPDQGTQEALGDGFYRITTTSIGSSGHGIHVGSPDNFLLAGKAYHIVVEITETSGMQGEVSIFRANGQFTGLNVALQENIEAPGTFIFDTPPIADEQNCLVLRMSSGTNPVAVGDTAVARVSVREIL